jgi:hypothetical protein
VRAHSYDACRSGPLRQAAQCDSRRPLTEFIDMFDIYLPVVVLTPVLAYSSPPTSSPGSRPSSALCLHRHAAGPPRRRVYIRQDRRPAWTSHILDRLGIGLRPIHLPDCATARLSDHWRYLLSAACAASLLGRRLPWRWVHGKPSLTNSAGRPLPEIILIVCALAILVTAPWG